MSATLSNQFVLPRHRAPPPPAPGRLQGISRRAFLPLTRNLAGVLSCVELFEQNRDSGPGASRVATGRRRIVTGAVRSARSRHMGLRSR